jgi:2'-5' RNA ligase
LTQRLESLQGKSFGSMQVAELTLMESKLTPAGPIYSPVERVRLAG